jgi:hypothetical protein
MFFSRGKNKIQDPYTIPDMYKEYIGRVDSETPYDVSYSVYKEITTRYFKKVANHLFEGGNFKIPYQLGILQIIKKKIYVSSQVKYASSIDWQKTVKYGKKIIHLNEHSNGYKYLFMWDKAGAKRVNISKYRFVPTRQLKRYLAQLIKSGKKDYIEYDL